MTTQPAAEQPIEDPSPYLAHAEAAARWWTQQVVSPIFQQVVPGGPEQDHRSDLTELLFSVAASKAPVDDGDARRFYAALRDALLSEFERMATFATKDGRSLHYTLSVDYGPDQILRKAAEAAGVSTSRFPIKTCMWVNERWITAARGYGAPTRLVHLAEGVEHPSCDEIKYEEKPHFIRLPWRCSEPRWHEDAHTHDVPQPLCKTCNAEPEYMTHRAESWRPADHEFEEGPVEVCGNCGQTRERASDDTRCRAWDERSCNWEFTGTLHAFAPRQDTALQPA
jgi:hypothetical protein